MHIYIYIFEWQLLCILSPMADFTNFSECCEGHRCLLNLVLVYKSAGSNISTVRITVLYERCVVH